MNIFEKSIKSLMWRMGFALAPIRPEYKSELYSRLYSKDSVDNKRFYNVGSGSFYHPNWTNLDYVSDWYKNVQSEVIHVNLMELKPLPLESGKAEVFYTSHTIEHVKDEAVMNLFKEVHRCLKGGGYFRVTTGPDADNDYDALLRVDEDWFYWDHWYAKPGSYERIYHKPATSVPLEERWLHHVATQLCPNDISPSPVKFNAGEIRELIKKYSKEDLLNYLTSLCQFQPERSGNHVSWWNAAKIERYLRKAGFTTVYKSAYEQSRCPILRDSKFFDNTHPQISVYVEAQK